MKKYLVLFFILFSISSFGQEIPMNFSFMGGFNVSHLKIDTVTTTPAYQPIIGMNYTVHLKNRFSTKIGLSFSNRGSNEGTTIKHRISYIDLIFLPTFKLFDGLNLELGGQYAILYNSYDKIVDGYAPNGELKISTSGYKSYPEFYAGISIELEKSAHIGCRYMIPTKNIPYSNMQFTVNVFVNPEKVGKEKNICTSLDEAIKNSNTVTKLVLQRKKLTHIPYEVFNMPNLEELVLDGNNITEIPKEIGQLKKLKSLSVKYNQIETLPSEIGLLENLEKIELEYNNLQTIPIELCNLPKLRFLMIGKNNIQFLPDEIGNLTNLLELNLAYSGALIKIPSSISNIRTLEYLYVDTTTLIPENILNSPRTIYNYIENNENGSPQTTIAPSRYLKIIIVTMF